MAGAFTSQATTEPWEQQIPHLKKAFQTAENLYLPEGQPTLPAYYSGKTVAGFDPYQTMAQESIVNYAKGDAPVALQSAASVANLGQMYGQTPFSGEQRADLLAGRVNTGAGTPYGAIANTYGQQFIDQMTKGLADVRKGQIMYQPGGSSRGDIYQSNVATGASQALAQNLANLYGGAYQTAQSQRFPMAQMELGQKAAGLGAYPTIMGAPLSMYQAIGDVGAQRRAMTQEGINQAMMRYNYEAQRPQTALQNYLSSISGAYGGRSTATPSAIGALGQVGAALSGLGMFK
jgi:hypothetical protein